MTMNSKNFKDKYEVDYGGSWLITYSDMITIILCFFIVFFTYTAEEASILETIKESLTSQVDGLNQENEKLKEEKESLYSLLMEENDTPDSSSSFLDFLKENNLMESVNIIQGNKGMVIRFKEGVLFNSGEASISEGGFTVLHEIVEKIKSIPNLIIIEGFTDNIPIKTNEFPSNWELSVARAMGVARFMIDDMNIEEERISVSGFGEQRPIDSNDTAEGRANNRRIEITILD